MKTLVSAALFAGSVIGSASGASQSALATPAPAPPATARSKSGTEVSGASVLSFDRELLRKYAVDATKGGASTTLKVPATFPSTHLAGKDIKVLAGTIDKPQIEGQVILKTKSGEKIPLKLEAYSQLWLTTEGSVKLANKEELNSKQRDDKEFIVLFAEQGSEKLIYRATANPFSAEIAPPAGGPPPVPIDTPKPNPLLGPNPNPKPKGS